MLVCRKVYEFSNTTTTKCQVSSSSDLAFNPLVLRRGVWLARRVHKMFAWDVFVFTFTSPELQEDESACTKGQLNYTQGLFLFIVSLMPLKCCWCIQVLISTNNTTYQRVRGVNSIHGVTICPLISRKVMQRKKFPVDLLMVPECCVCVHASTFG